MLYPDVHAYLFCAVGSCALCGDIVIEFAIVDPETCVTSKGLIWLPFLVSMKVEIPVNGKHTGIFQATKNKRGFRFPPKWGKWTGLIRYLCTLTDLIGSDFQSKGTLTPTLGHVGQRTTRPPRGTWREMWPECFNITRTRQSLNERRNCTYRS